MLLGCGLRRGELLGLRVDSIQSREERWVIADLLGKAGHVRTVPIPNWVKAAVEKWTEASGIISGTLFQSIDRRGRVWGTGMTPKVLWEIVKAAATRADIPKLAPHDLRRYALGFAILPVENSIRFSSCSDTSPSKPPSTIWDVNRSCGTQSMTTWGFNRE
jgi:integrase